MYRLQTLGGLALRTGEGEEVEALVGRTQALALLAYLAVEGAGERVGRGDLAALFWPDRSEEQARHSLRSVLYDLRQATDPPVVAGKDTAAVWVPAEQLTTDMAAFREAIEREEPGRALELYQGPFLAGVHLSGARGFERWADRQRGRCRQQAYDAALARGRRARDAGEWAEAEAAFRQALDLAPVREEAAERLIRTLTERGRPADALQLYEAFRQRREEELELAPSEELERLVERIRAGNLERGETKSARETKTGKTPGPEAVRPDGKGQGGAEKAEPTGAAAPGAMDTTGRFWGVSTVSAVAALVFVIVVFSVLFEVPGAGNSEAAAGDRSVAVLPFETTGTEDPGPIAAGLHSDLLTRLSAVGDLKVISATSVEHFREAGLPLPAIADSLGVTWVVEGVVQSTDDAIQVNAQLIDPRTDTHAWAKTYRRELTAENLFDLQSDITRRIVESLETRVTGVEEDRLDRRTTGSLQAHRFYIRGRSLLEQREVPAMRRALDYFEQALAEDSSYALAWAGKADALTVLPRYPDADPDTLLPAAAEAVERALALEPELAEAHVVRGRLHMYRREGPAALRDFQRAVELKPSHAAAHAWLGKLQLALGRPEAARASAERSVELDPMSVENQGVLYLASSAEGRYEEALAVVRDIDELGRGAPRYLNEVFAHLGRSDELKRLARERERMETGSLAYWFFLAVSGDTAAAPRVLAKTDGSRTPVVAAIAHSLAGRQDRAFELLEEAYPRSEWLWDIPFTVWLRYFWPESLEPLRHDPRYQKLIREMNAHWDLNPDGSLPDSVDVSFDASADD